MASIPSKRKVEQALREAERSARAVVKEANKAAGKQVSKGDYAGSERLITLAKSATGFVGEVQAIRKRWREATSQKGAAGGNREPRTPLWQYYQHILKALVELGGRATRNQIEDHLGSNLNGILKPADCERNARGVEWWRIMVRRSRKHMQKEGFIEPGVTKEWSITTAGRKGLDAGKLNSKIST